MKFILFTVLTFCSFVSNAQQIFRLLMPIKSNGNESIQLNEAVVVSTRLFTDDTARYRYNQMKHYVKMILPLVDTAVNMFHDIDEKVRI